MSVVDSNPLDICVIKNSYPSVSRTFDGELINVACVNVSVTASKIRITNSQSHTPFCNVKPIGQGSISMLNTS